MAQFNAIGSKIVKLAKNTSFSRPFGLCCGTAGTFTGTDAMGNAMVAYPLQAGYNPISIGTWTAGSADDVWGLYEADV